MYLPILILSVALARSVQSLANPVHHRHEGFSPSSPPPKLGHSHAYGSDRGTIRSRSPQSAPSYGGSRNGLTSYQQNGGSDWGSLNQTNLPQYYGGGRGDSGKTPWGKITTNNSNPYTSAPKGTVRSYDFTIASCDIRPDGVQTQGAICVNGQFPGPLIEANYGDTIQVKVTNKLANEGTSLHWHGFLMTGTNQMDGVPGITQCPIAPGSSQTYTFKAELYGHSWYHSHYSAQYAGGAVGPMVIYGPVSDTCDVDLGPIMLSEFYRKDYMSYIKGLMRPLRDGGPIMPLASSNLINGKMRFPCSKTNLPCVQADYARFNFTSGKRHRLRLVNMGSNTVQKFSIDGHTLEVISNDFMPIQPYNTTMLALSTGQRAEVIVHGRGKPNGVYWMRSNIVGCSLNDGQLTEALAVIYYEKADLNTLPSDPPNQGPGADPSPRSCGNDPLTKTIPSFPLPARNPDITQTFDLNAKSNGTHMVMYFGNNTFRANFNRPVLYDLLGGIAKVDPQRNSWNIGTSKTVRLILYNWNDAPHPIHLHGHNMQVLNLGMGKWDGTIVRPSNPQRRDVQTMPPAANPTTPSFLVIQFEADNPGIWPLHCHFSWHSSMGLAMNIIEAPKSMLTALGGVAASSKVISQTCFTWNTWSYNVKKLDSGIDSGM